MKKKKCKACGKCCKVMTFPIQGVDKDSIEFYEARGCKLKDGFLQIPFRCPHLTKDNKCDIHETKPAVCRAFNCWESPSPFNYDEID